MRVWLENVRVNSHDANSENSGNAYPKCCVPLYCNSKGGLILLWDCTDASGKAVNGKAEDAGSDDFYEAAATAKVQQILKRVCQRDHLSRQSPDDGWCTGGIMTRLTSALTTARNGDAGQIAFEAYVARASQNKGLLFVWDLVSLETRFSALKFVLDAGRSPLQNYSDFETVYGLPRRLQFTTDLQFNRSPHDMFKGLN